jgi:threonine dehydratase
MQIPEDRRGRGVVAFSSGNHAQGVALAAKMLGMPATIVMPERSVPAKVEATRSYGATVVQSGVTESTRGTSPGKSPRRAARRSSPRSTTMTSSPGQAP